MNWHDIINWRYHATPLPSFSNRRQYIQFKKGVNILPQDLLEAFEPTMWIKTFKEWRRRKDE